MTEAPRFDLDEGGLEIISMGGDHAVGAMIRKARIFGDLSADDAAVLARRAWAYKAETGTEILNEGECGGRLFLLIDGSVEIFKNDEQGHPQRITTIRPGATLGEMSLLDDLPFSATARVAIPATLIMLRKDEFDRLAEEHPQLHLRVLRRIATEMSLRLRKTTNTLGAYVGRVADLTESLHGALANNKSKTALLASMSHDLRTPLNAIIGFSELFEEEEETRERESGGSDIKRIQVAGRHMLSLINNILDFAKMEAGKMTFVPTRFTLRAVLAELETIVRPLARSRHNQLHIDDNNTELFTDKTKLMQILINLLGNACKFTDNGAIHLRIVAHHDQIEFAVQDTGIGIPADQLARLFQVFEQANNAAQNGLSGSGLGLHLSQLFAQKLGGGITVHSREGKGSTFTLTLPYKIEHVG